MLSLMLAMDDDMNIAWYMLRLLYWIGLLPTVLLLFIVMLIFDKDPSLLTALLVGCLTYFALGYVILKVAPRVLRRRLLRPVVDFKAKGFAPTWEVESIYLNRYLGFDTKMRNVLFICTTSNVEELLDFGILNAWEIERTPRGPAIIKLLTRSPSYPVVSACISRYRVDEWRSYLMTICAKSPTST